MRTTVLVLASALTVAACTSPTTAPAASPTTSVTAFSSAPAGLYDRWEPKLAQLSRSKPDCGPTRHRSVACQEYLADVWLQLGDLVNEIYDRPDRERYARTGKELDKSHKAFEKTVPCAAGGEPDSECYANTTTVVVSVAAIGAALAEDEG